MKIKILYSFLALMVFSSCANEQNPSLIDSLFFDCNPTGVPLVPGAYQGIPETCLSPIFEEDFSDNDKGWYERNDNDYYFVVKDGRYNLQSKINTSFYIGIPLDPLQTFDRIQIEMTLKILEDNSFSSLNWGGVNYWEQTQHFGIHNSQYFVASNQNDQTIDLQYSLPSTYVLQLDENPIKMTIRIMDDIHYFFINENYIGTVNMLSLFGDQITIRVGAYSTIQIDDFSIKRMNI